MSATARTFHSSNCPLCETVIQTAPDGYILAARSGAILDVNARYCAMSGFDRDELTAMRLGDLEQPGSAIFADLLSGMEPGRCAPSELHPSLHRHKIGTAYPVEVRAQEIPNECDDILVFVRDLTGDKNARRQTQLTQHTLNKMTDMVIWLDANGKYVFVNDAATKLLGYSREELSNMYVHDVDPFFDPEKWRQHWAEIEKRKSFTIETVNISKSGSQIPIEVTVNFIEHEGHKFNCSIVRDISERIRMSEELRQANQKLLHLSQTDELTQLANRRRLMECLRAEYARHARSGAPLSFILLDMDAFKGFNDHYGHLEGDACLQRLASVLARQARRPDDLAARYGGEEFACLLPATDSAGATGIAETIRTSIMDLGIPHARSPVASVVTASMGVATAHCTEDGAPDQLIARADQLLYQAKKNGRNQIAVG